jgi:hypothetical protein
MSIGNYKAVKFLCLVGVLLCLFTGSILASHPVPRSKYLAYARASADWVWEHYDDVIQRWKESFDPENVFGYRAPGGLLEMAVIYSFLYEKEKNEDYARRAKKVLLSYGDYRSLYPGYARKKRPDYADGIPALPNFFTSMRYIRAYDTLNRLGFINPEENRIIVPMIAESMKYLLRTQEWGPMNRTALRAETLAWAVRALPDFPQAGVWEMQRKALGDDNWGNWEIEDATIYHAVWLYALLGYSDVMGRMENLLKTPEMYYYAQYFLHLMCPANMIPDFGDADWLSNWNRYLVFFEAAAAFYKDPHLKWAASTIAETFIDFDNPTSVGLGYLLLDCYRWGDDSIPSRAPTVLSGEVMEDVQGKKIVFRNGWDPESAYLLLNYRDEGDGGLNFRDYLRDTIPVEEEKMTHGHADENSIILLMAGGSVLLRDGGYRDYMPSGPYGAYRQDYFHNRLCVKPEKLWMGQKKGQFRYSIRDAVPGQKVLEFLHNAGSYRIIRTQKVDFLTLPDFDYSRTRLTDDQMGYQWDRIITYIKEPGIYVVFDVFKGKKEGYFTLCNLWHTRTIKAQGDHWYDTVYDRIRDRALSTGTHLLIVFPLTHYKLEGVEHERRHYQDELVIHQTTAQHFELGETVGFITVLIPHPSNQPPEEWVKNVALLPVQPERSGLGVQITVDGKLYMTAVKNDLRMDMSRDFRRPRYTYEAGRISFGQFETNGDFLFAKQGGSKLDYTIVNLTKAVYGNKILFQAKPSVFGLAFDASPDQSGVGKIRYWRDSVSLK